MEVTQHDIVTVSALRSRLSELQTLWNTATKEEHLPHSRSASASKTRIAKEESYDRDVSHVEQLTDCAPHSVAQRPAKPSTPPLTSPRPFHRHAPPTMFALAGNEGGDQSCDNFVSVSPELLPSLRVSCTPRTSSTPPTGTPRARPRSVVSTSPTLSPVRTSHEAVTLPPIQAHVTGTAPVTCAHCGAKAARASAAYCSRCGKRLAVVV